MEKLQTILGRLNGSGTTFEEMTPKEFEQFKVDSLNATEGTRHLEDGYNCKQCKNKGYIVKLQQLTNGHYTQVMAECKCAETRRSIHHMKKSGLKNIITDYTFDKFEVTEVWQQKIKDAAMEYAAAPEGWFFLCGQSGAGKSHLCTAICREFLLKGRRVAYMAWRDDIEALKDFDGDSERRLALMERFKTAEVLYIDDLFKTGKKPEGGKQKPTSTDINKAFEMLNYRYNNPHLLTIISSEWTVPEILDIDEAVGGRIFERAGDYGFNIDPDKSRNYRTRKMVTI